VTVDDGSTGRPVVVVLRGAPGVGKSTLAERLHRDGTFQAVIEVDAIRPMLMPDPWTDRAVHRRALMSAVDLAASFARSGVQVIALVDALDCRLLEELVVVLGASGLAFRLVALHVPPDVLRARIERRPKLGGSLELSLLLNDDAARGHHDGERRIEVSGGLQDAAAVLRQDIRRALAQ
jgi:predicted kinase